MASSITSSPSPSSPSPSSSAGLTVASSSARGMSVLVVDDASVDRRVIASFVQRAGYTASTASGGEDALAALAAGAFDVVLMDVNMPEMDGIETLAEMSRRRTLSDVTVIMMSNDATEKRVIRAIELGAVDFIVKPMTPHQLHHRITKAVNEHKAGRKFFQSSFSAPQAAVSAAQQAAALSSSSSSSTPSSSSSPSPALARTNSGGGGGADGGDADSDGEENINPTNPSTAASQQLLASASSSSSPVAPATYSTSPSPSPAPSSRIQVLAVDDSVSILRFLEKKLTSAGYEVTLAMDGGEGLDVLTERARVATDKAAAAMEAVRSRGDWANIGAAAYVQPVFDVILLDVLMPVISGKEFIRRAKGMADCVSSIPIIMMSSLGDAEWSAECLALGADGYLQKPFQREIVERTINRTLSTVRLRRFCENRLALLSTGDVAVARGFSSPNFDDGGGWAGGERRHSDAVAPAGVAGDRGIPPLQSVVGDDGSPEMQSLLYGSSEENNVTASPARTLPSSSGSGASSAPVSLSSSPLQSGASSNTTSARESPVGPARSVYAGSPPRASSSAAAMPSLQPPSSSRGQPASSTSAAFIGPPESWSPLVLPLAGGALAGVPGEQSLSRIAARLPPSGRLGPGGGGGSGGEVAGMVFSPPDDDPSASALRASLLQILASSPAGTTADSLVSQLLSLPSLAEAVGMRVRDTELAAATRFDAKMRKEKARRKEAIDEALANANKHIARLLGEASKLSKQVRQSVDVERSLSSQCVKMRDQIHLLVDDAARRGYLPLFYSPSPYAPREFPCVTDSSVSGLTASASSSSTLLLVDGGSDRSFGASPEADSFGKDPAFIDIVVQDDTKEAQVQRVLAVFSLGAAQWSSPSTAASSSPSTSASQVVVTAPESLRLFLRGTRGSTQVTTLSLPTAPLFRGSAGFMRLVAEVCDFPAYFSDLVFDRVKAHQRMLLRNSSAAAAVAVVAEDAAAAHSVTASQFFRFCSSCPSGGPLCLDRLTRFWDVVATRGAEGQVLSYVRYADLAPVISSLIDYHADLAPIRNSPTLRDGYVTATVTSIICSLHGQRGAMMTFNEFRTSNLMEAFYIVAAGPTRGVVPFSVDFFSELCTEYAWIVQKSSLAGSSTVAAASASTSASTASILSTPFPVPSGYITKSGLVQWGRDPKQRVVGFVLDRIFAGVPRPVVSSVPDTLCFADFVWYFLAVKDRMFDTSIPYWFKCLDLDDDGYLSAEDLAHVYIAHVAAHASAAGWPRIVRRKPRTLGAGTPANGSVLSSRQGTPACSPRSESPAPILAASAASAVGADAGVATSVAAAAAGAGARLRGRGDSPFVVGDCGESAASSIANVGHAASTTSPSSPTDDLGSRLLHALSTSEEQPRVVAVADEARGGEKTRSSTPGARERAAWLQREDFILDFGPDALGASSSQNPTASPVVADPELETAFPSLASADGGLVACCAVPTRTLSAASSPSSSSSASENLLSPASASSQQQQQKQLLQQQQQQQQQQHPRLVDNDSSSSSLQSGSVEDADESSALSISTTSLSSLPISAGAADFSDVSTSAPLPLDSVAHIVHGFLDIVHPATHGVITVRDIRRAMAGDLIFTGLVQAPLIAQAASHGGSSSGGSGSGRGEGGRKASLLALNGSTSRAAEKPLGPWNTQAVDAEVGRASEQEPPRPPPLRT